MKILTSIKMLTSRRLSQFILRTKFEKTYEFGDADKSYDKNEDKNEKKFPKTFHELIKLSKETTHKYFDPDNNKTWFIVAASFTLFYFLLYLKEISRENNKISMTVF